MGKPDQSESKKDMETLRVTFVSNQQPLAPYWSRESFIVPIAQLKRRGQWHRGDAVKFIGQFRPLNRLLKEDSDMVAMWLGEEEYKVSVKLAEFETIAFDVWHCKQHQLRQIALLEWLMERAKEKRQKKKLRKRRDSSGEKWNKITIMGDHNRVGRLVRDFAHVDSKGIRFSHSTSSSSSQLDHYDFFVRAHLAKTTEQEKKKKHANFDEYGLCQWCDKWTRGGVCKRQCDSMGGSGEDESSYVTIKYRRGDRKFDIFEYDNRADKVEFIHKVMYRSIAMTMAPKKTVNRQQTTDELIKY